MKITSCNVKAFGKAAGAGLVSSAVICGVSALTFSVGAEVTDSLFNGTGLALIAGLGVFKAGCSYQDRLLTPIFEKHIYKHRSPKSMAGGVVVGMFSGVAMCITVGVHVLNHSSSEDILTTNYGLSPSDCSDRPFTRKDNGDVVADISKCPLSFGQ